MDDFTLNPVGATGTALTADMLRAAAEAILTAPEDHVHAVHPNALLRGGWAICAFGGEPIDIDVLRAAGLPPEPTIREASGE